MNEYDYYHSINKYDNYFIFSRCEDKVSGYICECFPGYTGEKCEIPALHCSGSPCRRGKCVEKDKTFECQCPPGFGGNFVNKVCYNCKYMILTTSQLT